MTINDLVTRSLQLAGVVGMNRTPSAAEMIDGIATLNEMLEAWALDGMDMGLGTFGGSRRHARSFDGRGSTVDRLA